MLLRNVIIIIFGIVIMLHVAANSMVQEGNVSQGTSKIINQQDHPNLYEIISTIIDKLLPKSLRNPPADGKFASTCINVLSDEKYAKKNIKKLDILDLIRNIKEIKTQLSTEIEKDLRVLYDNSNEKNDFKILYAILLFLGDFRLDKSQMNIAQIKGLKKLKEDDEFKIYLWNIQLLYDDENFKKFNEMYIDAIANDKWVSINSDHHDDTNDVYESLCKKYRSDIEALIRLLEKLNRITPDELRMALEKTLNTGEHSESMASGTETKGNDDVESVMIPQHKREIATHQFISTIEDAIHEYRDDMRSV